MHKKFPTDILPTSVGLDVEVKSIPNPRKELEEHYYNPKHSGLLELGLKPNYLTNDVLVEMLNKIIVNKDKICLLYTSPSPRDS